MNPVYISIIRLLNVFDYRGLFIYLFLTKNVLCVFVLAKCKNTRSAVLTVFYT